MDLRPERLGGLAVVVFPVFERSGAYAESRCDKWFHCHPVKRDGLCWKRLTLRDLHKRIEVSDLNSVLSFSTAATMPNWRHARRKADFLSSHGLDSS